SSCDNFGLVVLEAIASGERAIVDDSLRGTFDDFEKLGVIKYLKRDKDSYVREIKEWNTAGNYELVHRYMTEKYDWKVIDEKMFMKFEELAKIVKFRNH
ncbi:MAG: hypothetical protein QXQ46_11615, partial [Thermoplasmatales archaeon]